MEIIMRKFLALLVTFGILAGNIVSAAALPETTSVESEISGSKDFYISQEGHKVHWGGGVGIPENISDDDYSLIVAFYDDGKLLHTDMNELDEDVTGFAFNEQILRLSYEPENLSAKAFLWNGVSDFKPLCQAVNIKNVPYTTYYAKGRVVSTYKDGRVGKGEVELSLEYSENFDGQQIIDGDCINVYASYTDEDINNHLFEYMDFAIAIDENDNVKLVSYTPLDCNKIVTFSGENLVEYYEEEYIIYEEDGVQNEIELSRDCIVYVNGVEAWGYNLFDLNLSSSDIKAVDIPYNSGNTTDGMYDYIFVDTYAWAVVDSVEITDETAKIYFNNYDTSYNMNAIMTVDFAGEDCVVNIYKSDMTKAGVDDIKPGDMLYIKFDVMNDLKDSAFADIIISDNAEVISLFSLRSVSKYLDVYEVKSLPKLVNNENGFRIEGKLQLDTFGDDLYDVIMNVKSGENVLYTKEFKADSRMEFISVKDSLDFEPDSTMYMTVSLVHNGLELYPTVESDITDGYAEIIGRMTGINGDNATVLIEKADDFFGQSYNIDYDYFEFNANISYLEEEPIPFVCSKMKIEKENGEYIVKSCKPYNTDIVELDTADFNYYDYYDYDNIVFKEKYRLSDDITAFVNGIEMRVDDVVEDYIENNMTGKVTLIDTPIEGARNRDGRYDYMYVTYSEWAVVDTIEESTIYFSDYQSNNGLQSTLDIDTVKCTFTRGGEEASIDDIKAGDILLIKYDVSDRIKYSEFAEIEICDTVVTGIVEKKSGNNTYQVDGKEYTYIDEWDGLSVGKAYKLHIDPYNRIIYYEETDINLNYGIVTAVENDCVEICTMNGKRQLFTASDDEVLNNAESLSGRAVIYELEGGYLSEIENVEGISVTGVYNGEENKIGDFEFSEYAAFFDATGFGEVNKFRKWDFVDGVEYEAEFYGSHIDGKSALVVLRSIPEVKEEFVGLEPETAFSVVKNISRVYKDGMVLYEIEVFENGQSKIIYAEDCNFENGAVIAYSVLNGIADREEDITVLIDPEDISGGNEAIDYRDAIEFRNQSGFIADPFNLFNDFYIESGISVWDESTLSTDGGAARVGFGAIVDKSSFGVSVAIVEEADSDIEVFGYTVVRAGDCYSDNIEEFDISDNCNVYVYDFNERWMNRLTVGSVGNIVKTVVPPGQLIEDENGDYIYNWSEIDSVDYANYAYFKTLNGQITDILVIIPSEDW